MKGTKGSDVHSDDSDYGSNKNLNSRNTSQVYEAELQKPTHDYLTRLLEDLIAHLTKYVSSI